jgi:hypothetical protein
MTYTDWIKAVAAHLLAAEAPIYNEDEAPRLYTEGHSPLVAAQMRRIDGRKA